MIKIYKDDFKRFFLCPKWMWLMKNRRNPAVKTWAKTDLQFLHQDKEIDFFSDFIIQTKPQITDNVGMRIMGGIWFEEIVLKHFQKQKKVFIFQRHDIKSNAYTQTRLNDTKYDVFHQPWFAYKDAITQCDFLIRNGDGFDLYEVKGVNEVKTAKKRLEYFSDLAYQAWILKQCNVRVKNLFLLHLNRDYLFQNQLDVAKLIKINDEFNTFATKSLDLTMFLPQIRKYLQLPFSEAKAYLTDLDCQETKINWKTGKINLTNLCSMIVPALRFKHHILHFYRLLTTKKTKLYAQAIRNNLSTYLNLETFPLSAFENLNWALKNIHFRQLAVVQNQAGFVDNHALARKQLNLYQYPIYFYDFETTPTPLPCFNAASPYLQIPFQFSIHILEHPNQDLKSLKHHAFLTTTRSDPRLAFTRAFLKSLKILGQGSYVAYHKGFELSILRNLLKALASQLNAEEQTELKQIISQTLDLKDFFRDLNIYLPSFYGSLSIKKTLPAFAPDFSYQNLAIQKGDQASALYFAFLYNLMDQKAWIKQRQNLLAYCERDTMAMVVIFTRLYRLLTAKQPSE